jgi:hypothetical protein
MQEIKQSNARVVVSDASEVERLAREMAEMRAELEAVRAQVMGHQTSSEPDARLGQRPPSAKRRLGWRRPTSSGEGGSSGLVSRRRLFGLLGGAAAVGTGLAVAGSTLTADPAAAAGDMVIDGSNTGAATTDLSSSTTGTAMTVESANGNAFAATANAGGTGVKGTSTSGNGVYGVSTSGHGVVGQVASGYGLAAEGLSNSGAHGAQLWLEQDTSVTGPPTSGTHQVGEFFVDLSGSLFYCVASSAAGTWVNLSSGTMTIDGSNTGTVARQRPATGSKGWG